MVLSETECSLYFTNQLDHFSYFDSPEHLTLPEEADLAQNRPLWRMMSTYGAMQS